MHSSFHEPVVSEVRRHDSGTLAVKIGEWPTELVLFFETNEAWDAFVDTGNAFIIQEEFDRADGLSA